MSLNPLAWIRSSVRDAVLAGFADGLAVIDPGSADAATAADALRQRLAAPLPRPEGQGRPDSLPAPADVQEAHAGNGKGRRTKGD